LVRLEKRAVAPTPTPPITFVNEIVYAGNGQGYLNWVDLDLSPWIGANRAIVWLRCYNNVGNPTVIFCFKEKGEIKDAEYDTGISSGYASPDDIVYVWALTDANGVLEWYADETVLVNIRLRAYIKA